MGTLYTDLATKQNNADVAAKTIPQEVHGRVRVATGTITPGTQAAGEIINLVKLPAGARVLASSKLYFAAGQGATMTLACGDAVTANRYLTAVAPGVNACTLDLSKNVATPYNLASEGWIYLTSGTAALAAAAISFDIYYVID